MVKLPINTAVTAPACVTNRNPPIGGSWTTQRKIELSYNLNLRISHQLGKMEKGVVIIIIVTSESPPAPHFGALCITSLINHKWVWSK